MRLFRFISISLFTFMSLVVFSGCQKDPVTPQSSHIESAGQSKKSTSKETKSKEDQASHNAHSDKDKSGNSNTSNSGSKSVGQDKKSSMDSNVKNSTGSPTNKTTEKTQTSHAKDTAKIPEQKTEKSSNNTSQTKSSATINTNTNSQTVKTNQAEESAVSIDVKGDSQKGTILSVSKAAYKKGDTVLTMTLNLLKQKGIQYSVRGSGATAYLEGIDNLYEFDDGPLSGWNVILNGKLLSKSAGAMKLTNGDHIVWSYTTDYKKDGQG
jgi:hypothetical protein